MPDPQVHDPYDWSENLLACHRCGGQWRKNGGDWVGYVSAEAEEAGLLCPPEIDGDR